MVEKTPLKVTAAPTSASSLSGPAACADADACKLTAGNLAANSGNAVNHEIRTIVVSGQDLTHYMNASCADTPFERFLKEENGLQRLASSPWLARVNKL